MRPDQDHLDVRLPFIRIEAKGPNATRTVGKAVLILAVTDSTLAVWGSHVPYSLLGAMLSRLWQSP
jgi:hypothetical protein